MDSQTPSLDFAVIGHQDGWANVAAFINGIRAGEMDPLPVEAIRNTFPFIPPRDLFRVNVRSKTGTEINGVYIESFIDPDKLDASFTRSNIGKVMKAASCAKRMGAKITALGGFTSIVLEGELGGCVTETSKFTTGNTLTAAFIVKGVEKAAALRGIDLGQSNCLIAGSTGDIGTACVNYFKTKVKKLLLCARNKQRLEKQAQELINGNIPVEHSVLINGLVPEADIIISVTSSRGIKLANCKKNVLICDAGYPKNLETNGNIDVYLFHGGMGQVSEGFTFMPDHPGNFYRYAAPHIIHGCILEAMVLAFEKKYEVYSAGKGNISIEKMEEIYNWGSKHGICIAPFYNEAGLWEKNNVKQLQ